jgi:hypothetical protein
MEKFPGGEIRETILLPETDKGADMYESTISRSAIRFVRGDTRIITLAVKDATGAAYLPQQGDILTMTVRNGSHSGEVVLLKTNGPDVYIIEGGLFQIIIRPEDTAGLPYTTYKYDIELQLANAGGAVVTVIPCSDFILDKEVTYDD